jgi:D-arabinose 1-dehydrogenase-like Zn-dependent alcohol dehydrogenase
MTSSWFSTMLAPTPRRFSSRTHSGVGPPENALATLVGSFGSTKDDVIAVYELLDSGQLSPLITTLGFDEIGTRLDRLRRGEAQGRLVATLD